MSVERAVTAVLAKRLIDERQSSVDLIVSGTCEDFSRYRYSAGYIKALDDVATICNEILSDIQKG